MPKPNLDERFRLARDYLEKHGKTDENGEKWIDLDTAAAIIGPVMPNGYSGKIPRAAAAALEREADCKIPTPAFMALERDLAGITHGTASLTIRNGKITATIVFHVRDGRLTLYEIDRHILPEAGDGQTACRYEFGRHLTFLPEPSHE
jgi:hypothetical protein